jgi:aspartate racemase
MGPAAGADFARLFVQACTDHMLALRIPVSDQAFPEHWLAQTPVPDRTTALESPGPGGHQPLQPMLQAMGKLAALGATTVAIACNTAHAWHGELQQRFPQLEVLHVAREVARTLAGKGIQEVGLLATEGTYRSGLYTVALQEEGIQCHVPVLAQQDRLMHGIYHGVKRGDMALASACFESVARSLAQSHGLTTLVMGCTEIPLALKQVPGLEGIELIDPAQLLARVLAQRAYTPCQFPFVGAAVRASRREAQGF